MPLIDVDALLAPAASEPPCGPDLGYAPEMEALRKVAAGTPERGVGDKIIAAQPPEWPEVARQSKDLLVRAKHLEVAVLITRAACWMEGYVGAVRGLALMRGLLERHWDEVWPRLDSSDGSAIERLNTLAPLTVGDDGIARALLRDLGLAPLDTSLGRAGLRVRDLTLAFGHAKPDGGESVPTAEGVGRALRDLLGQRPDLAQALADGAAHVQAIKTLLEEKAPTEAPNLTALLELTRAVAAVAQRATGGDGAQDQAAPQGAAPGGAGGQAVGALRTREDCVRALEQVCEWFARNEPSHPAPYVIQRAQRLVKMNFLEIIQDLAPSGLAQVQDVVGKPVETSS